MKTHEIRSAVHTLKAQGQSLRQISRLLQLSRNTVRRILRTAGEPTPSTANAADAPPREHLQALFERARGNVVRVAQLLAAEHGQSVRYSTLTRWVREAQLREPPQRAGEYLLGPGLEMQFDTSPHRLKLGEHTCTAQCAGLVLAYSRRLYVQYYPRFTRLEAKDFLLQAVRFMDGSAQRCVIDNSSVILAGGAGAQAVIAPEMQAFARALGFYFLAHRVNHPDRKGRIERIFAWVERGFLPGRTFADFADLNQQVLQWCEQIANQKPKRSLGMSPQAAYLIEKPYLQSLPSVLPPVYDVLERSVDLMGFVSVHTNRYSVPERWVGQPVTVYLYPSELTIHARGALIATHPRLIGRHDARHTLPEHHHMPRARERQPAPEEQWLRAQHPTLDRYVSALRASQPGRAVRVLRRLLQIQRTYPTEPFLAAVEQALKFGLLDLSRLERLVLKHVAGDFFALDATADEPTQHTDTTIDPNTDEPEDA
jgi:transposase